MSLKIEENKNLENFNTYKIKVKSKYFVELNFQENYDDIFELFKFIKKEKIKNYFILGSGSNVIFKKDFYDGLIIKLKNKTISWGEDKKVVAGAGMEWDTFLNLLQKRGERENIKGFFDIQSLSSIPGTVGAAIYGNIGAFGTEVKRYVFSVEYFDIKKQKVLEKKFQDLDFSYRNSFFKNNVGKYIILSVIFDFSDNFSKEIEKKYKKDEYFSLEHFAKKYDLGKITKKEIRKNILRVRKKDYPDVKKLPNVGSTFKNIEINKTILKKILEKYPDIPHWNLENGKIKIPTAFIFDKVLSLNRQQFGNIKIHKSKPLFFINTGRATGEEFYNLCQKIKEMTKEKLDLDIEEEVIFID